MHRRWKQGAATLIAALALTTPALGANVTLDGVSLEETHAWVEGGTSYIFLYSYAQHTPYTLSWDGSSAILQGEGLELSAQPGAPYVISNGRPIFVKGGVPIVEGRTALPLKVLAQATGASLRWDDSTSTAHLIHTQDQPESAAGYEEEDLYWLSRIISAESRGEPLEGQIAVGNVVLNRVASRQYPNSIKEVVFDVRNGVQFEPVSNGTIYDEPTESAVQAAMLCLDGANVVGDCMYFFAPALSSGTWIVKNCTYYKTIGCHRFYR